LAYAIPLLFESGRAYPEIDQTVAVVTPPELTIARAMARDNLSRAEIQARLDAQLPYDEKCRRADICVMNTGTIEELQTKARSLLEQLVQQ
jgi:dephospho-CoA kinase